MKKTLIKLLIIIYILIPITNIKALDTYSKNVVLYNMNEDKIIYEKDSDKKVKVASLTKIMTTIIALENINDIKEETIMPQEAFKELDGYVTSGFKINQTVTYEDLLYGTMLPSAADCANAIALKVSGTIDEFVELMNLKAHELNMESTHFSNPIGVDEDNYSTVNDIAILLKYALKNQDFYKIFTAKEYITSTNLKLESTIIEKSKPYNLDVSTILGSKTGFTDEAGNCLASISKINGVKYLLVTTNASINKSYHIEDAINIYDYYSKNYTYKKILNYNQLIKIVNVDKLFEKQYEIKADNDVYEYLNNEIDINNLTYEYEGIEKITKETNQHNPIGKLNIKYNNETIYTYYINIDKKIEFYDLKGIIIYAIIIFIILITIKTIKKHLHTQKKMIK